MGEARSGHDNPDERTLRLAEKGLLRGNFVSNFLKKHNIKMISLAHRVRSMNPAELGSLLSRKLIPVNDVALDGELYLVHLEEIRKAVSDLLRMKGILSAVTFDDLFPEITFTNVEYLSSAEPVPPGLGPFEVEVETYERFHDASLLSGNILYIDPGESSKEDIADLFSALSELNIALGGDGLQFTSSDQDSFVVEGLK